MSKKTWAELRLMQVNFPQLVLSIQRKISDWGVLVFQKVKKVEKIVKKTIMFVSIAIKFCAKQIGRNRLCSEVFNSSLFRAKSKS